MFLLFVDCAQHVSVPELETSSIGSVIVVLVCAFLIMTAGRKKETNA